MERQTGADQKTITYRLTNLKLGREVKGAAARLYVADGVISNDRELKGFSGTAKNIAHPLLVIVKQDLFNGLISQAPNVGITKIHQDQEYYAEIWGSELARALGRSRFEPTQSFGRVGFMAPTMMCEAVTTFLQSAQGLTLETPLHGRLYAESDKIYVAGYRFRRGLVVQDNLVGLSSGRETPQVITDALVADLGGFATKVTL
jgi:hypothetical protein